VAKRFGVADLNRGEFAWPDDGRRRQSRIMIEVTEWNIAWPCAVFRARNHGDPKQTIAFANPTFGDDERGTVLPRRPIGIGKG